MSFRKRRKRSTSASDLTDRPVVRNRRCLFCLNTNLTKEHYFGRWYARSLKEKFNYSVHNVDVFDNDACIVATKSVRATRKTGDPRQSAIKAVCRECNQTWMSHLQDRIRLLCTDDSFENRVLSYEEQTTLASYAVMFACVLELQHPNLAFSNFEGRVAFRESGRPVGGWAVWIGIYSGELWHGFNHFGGRASQKEIVLQGAGVQCTSWVIGRLFFLTYFQSSDLNFCPFFSAFEKKIIRVWPIGDDGLCIGNNYINDLEADRLSRAILSIPEGESRRAWEVRWP